MTINGLCNRFYGPGGGTPRLHQFYLARLSKIIWGRNRIDVGSKTFFSFGMVSAVIGLTHIVANDNNAPVAVAA